jgi:hypothetical protein
VQLAIAAIAASIALCGVAQASPNLIFNGDFELGNTGFYTDYTFSPDDGWDEGVYAIVYDPADWHPLAASYGDHTTGSGLMMAVNGHPEPNKIVWQQTVSVSANTAYIFSGWVSSWDPGSPAQLQISINSIPLGVVTAPSTTGVWQQFSFTWFSGTSTTAVLSIVNLNTERGGNDFALDDLSFVVPEPVSLLALGAGLIWIGGEEAAQVQSVVGLG